MKRLVIPDDSVVAAFMDSERVSELYCDEVLTGDGRLIRLDLPSSVSGLIRFGLLWGLMPVPDIIPPKEDPHGL